jgi:putative NADH-flavin reductase
MKLAIFGGTGRTGQYLIQQALEEGYQVVALARTPSKLDGMSTTYKDQLSIVTGDVQTMSSVEQVVAEADAVLSVLGPTNNQPTFEVSKGMQNILAAMKKHGITRIIISAGAGVGDPEDSPKLFNKLMNFVLKTTAKNVFLDMQQSVDLLRSSDLDWTIVRVPMLTDDPKKGTVKAAMVGKGMGARITRADMASYILDQVKSQEQIHKAPAISN